jgi:hypothetical protein
VDDIWRRAMDRIADTIKGVGDAIGGEK